MDSEIQIQSNLARIAILENERLRDIIHALGDDWKIIEVDSVNRNHFKFGPVGADYYLHTRDTKSFDVWLSNEGLRSVHNYFSDQFPSANISERKSPEKVATELRRRIVEPTLPILETLRVRYAEKLRRDQCIADNIRLLIEANPEAHQTSAPDSIYFNASNRNIYLSGTVSQDEVRFERVTLPVGIAVKLFQLAKAED